MKRVAAKKSPSREVSAAESPIFLDCLHCVFGTCGRESAGRREERELATRILAVGVGLLAGYAVVEAFVPLRMAGPVVAVGTVVLAVPMAVLGLRHAREAGTLLVLDGLVPVLGLALVALQHADESSRGLHLGGSSGVAGIPVLFVGALFLLAWVAGLQPAAGHRRAGPRHA